LRKERNISKTVKNFASIVAFQHRRPPCNS
jgi:hypothetical protein